MLDEFVSHLPRVDDLLSLAAPQLDGILLKCIAQRATSTDPIAAKYVFEDEIVGLYPIGVKASFQNSTAVNGALMEPGSDCYPRD